MMNTKDKMELIVSDTCPYCRKVENYLETREDLTVAIRSINNDAEAKEKLMEKGGMMQVPCLFVGDEPMYESEDIIKFLKGLE